MSGYADDLLRAAARLDGRRSGPRGPIRSAYIRRSISTTYYALFHFLLDEAAIRIIGAHHDLRSRRRLFIRTFTHAGLTAALGKLTGPNVHPSAADLFRLPSMAKGGVPNPPFVQQLAKAYLDAKSKREDADYNLNEPLSETDARVLRRRVGRAMDAWRAANTAGDRDIRHATCLLLSLKGQLRG